MLAVTYSSSSSTTPHRHSIADRLFGPRSHEHHTVTKPSGEVVVHQRRRLDAGTALRNTALGGAAGGALGGALYLTKLALPVIGKVTSLAGIARFAGAGAGIGLAATLLPIVWPEINQRPALKAAVTGAGIGATVGVISPIGGPLIGAGVGAAIGLGIHAIRKRPSYQHTSPPWPYVGHRQPPVPYCPPGMVPVPPGFGHGIPPFAGGIPPFAGGIPPYALQRPGLLSRIFGGHRPAHPAFIGAGTLPMHPGSGPFAGSPYGVPAAPGSVPQLTAPHGAGQAPGVPGTPAAAPPASPPAAGPAKARDRIVRRRAGRPSNLPTPRGVSTKAATRRRAQQLRRAARPVQPRVAQPTAGAAPQVARPASFMSPAAYLPAGMGQLMPFSSPFAANPLLGAATLGMPGPAAGMQGPAMPAMAMPAINAPFSSPDPLAGVGAAPAGLPDIDDLA